VHASLLLLALAAPPVVQLTPASVRPGDAFLVTVQAAEQPSGAVAGQPLQFFAAPGGFRAVGALPVETVPGTLEVPVALPSGERASGALVVQPGEFARKRLRVSERFVRPQPREVRRRMEADQRAFDQAFAAAEEPPLFSGPFAWPREDEVTGRFGELRVMNGRKRSRHFGTDLSGEMRDPVAASNAGRVVLVRDCWGSGLSVVLFHGAGLFSTYFHLSKADVNEGEQVARGQRIGLVGRSGRVTGPHLHWGVKVGERYVDPESVLRLPFD
jgi:murein DD-endopeptidase MepM/ murein hydrolase activator NlpD